MPTFERILVATDFTDAARAAVQVAGDMARRTGAGLDVAHVIDDRPLAYAAAPRLAELLHLGDTAEERRQRVLDAVRKEARAEGAVGAGIHAPGGDPSIELPVLRDELGADLLVCGAHGTLAVRHFAVGSTAERLLRRPASPLLLVRRAPPGGECKRILVGLEHPDRRTPALEFALGLAHDLRAEVCVLHVLPRAGYVSDRRHVELAPETARERIAAVASSVDRTVPIDIRVERGDPVDRVSRIAEELASELVVLGAERNADGWPGRVVDRTARSGVPALLAIWSAS